MNTKDLSLFRKPQRLYMYFRAESVLRFLEHHSLKLSDPTQFNDPFDCKVDYNRSLQPTGFLDAHPNAEHLNEWNIISLDNKHFDTISSYGISCFTTDADNILMWAYYAEGQKGVCVEFDTSKDPVFFKDLHKVIYSEQLGCIKRENGEWSYMDVYTTKLGCWEHEKEWRVIKPNMANTFFPIKPQAITGIIFGCASGDFRGKKDYDIQIYEDIIKLLNRPIYHHVRIQQIQTARTTNTLQHADLPFFVMEHKDNTISIISTQEQYLYLEKTTDESSQRKQIYSVPMNKLEEYKTPNPLPLGLYYIHNGKDPMQTIRVIPN